MMNNIINTIWLKIKNFVFKHDKISSFLLGCLSVLSLPPFYKWYLLFFCFSLLLLLLQKTADKKQAFTIGWLFGFGFFACGLSWINNALLINAAQTGWLIPVVFITSGAFFGLFIGIPCLCCCLFKKFYIRCLTLSPLIVLFEWLRSWILTGFPWNLWGTALMFNLEIAQTASIIGTYGLSLITIIVASSPALLLHYRNHIAAITCFITIIVLPLIIYCWGYARIQSLYDNNHSNTKIRLVQPSIPQSVKWSPDLRQQHYQEYINMSQSSSVDDISMTIWGETASPYPLDLDKEALKQALKAIGNNGYLTVGMVRYQDNYYGGYQPFNSSLIISKNGTIENFYDKSHLVPFGEYIPLRQFLPQFIRPIANTISDFKAGNGPKVIKLPNIPAFGIQICYEIIFPHQIINAKNKPDWLINLTNDGWYGISSGPYQHMVNTQLRAIEEGITIVRSANSGISGLINRYGKIISYLELNRKGILDIYLPQQLQTTTVYNQFGNTTILTICLLIITISLYLSNKTLIRK